MYTVEGGFPGANERQADSVTRHSRAAAETLARASLAHVRDEDLQKMCHAMTNLKNGTLNVDDTWMDEVIVNQASEIIAFSRNLGTNNQIHLSREAAKSRGFEDVVAPGGMIYGFIEDTVTGYAPNVTLREISLKFKRPLYAPARVHIECTVRERAEAMGITLLVVVRQIGGGTSQVLANGTCRIIER
jgi:acyl dehydratase